MDAKRANNRGPKEPNVHPPMGDETEAGGFKPGNDDGATVTEYAIMLALITMTCIGAVTALGTKVESVFAFLP